MHRGGDEGQPGCWTWGGALSPQGPLGSAEGKQETEETKKGLLGRKGKTRGWRVLVGEGGSVSSHWAGETVSCGGHALSPEGQPEEVRPGGCRLHDPEFMTQRILTLLTGHRPKAKGFTGLISHGKILLLCQKFIFTGCEWRSGHSLWSY